MTDPQIKLLTFEVAVSALVVSLIALLISYVNARLNIRNKQIDAIFHDHKRFDELQALRAALRVAELDVGKNGGWSLERFEMEVTSFFDRFWSLQFDAYIAWLAGYIPSSIYTYWLFSRWRELHEPSDGWTLSKHTLATSLTEIDTRWKKNPDPKSDQSKHVNDFLSMMFELKERNSVDINKLLTEFGPGRARGLIRQIFGRY
jgi:hypothetical protein